MAENTETSALLSNAYTAEGDGSLFDIYRHFTTRGHKGPIQSLQASAQADLIITAGVDYSIRVWKYDPRYEAYDLIAMVAYEAPPEFVKQPPSLFESIKEMIYPTPVEWDKVPRQGVTAIACANSKASEDEPPRFGPILSGTAHGDFYSFCLSTAEEVKSAEEEEGTKSNLRDPVSAMYNLHEKAINDICVAPTYPQEDSIGDSFLVMTASEDGTSALLLLTCREDVNPNLTNHKRREFDSEFVDVLLCGGGGRKEWWAEHAEELEETEAKNCLMFENIEKITKCEHDNQPVKAVRHLGDNRLPDRAAFATCTVQGAHLWTFEGNPIMVLTINTMNAPTKAWDPVAYKEATVEVEITEHSAIASVNKKKGSLLGSLLFLEGGGHVGVWGLENGKVGFRTEDGTLNYDDDHWKQARNSTKNGKIMEPLCVYPRPGERLDIDQSGNSTTFAIQLMSDRVTASMWGLEAVAPGLLVVEPEGPASLLICPGRDLTQLQLNHESPVHDMRVVEDTDGPALISGCEDGSCIAWDLEGGDKGQKYADMRSLSPLEILLPPILLLVTAVQMLSFAFGPAIPWKKELHKPANVYHKVMMLDFKFTIDIDKETIFWPEMYLICSFIIFFQVSAMIGLPERMDQFVRGIDNLACLKDESSLSCFRHPLRQVAKFLRGTIYLLMQLLSTVLVVPMIQSCAQAVDCNRPEDVPLTEVFGNPSGKIWLSAAPHVKCYRDSHLQLMGVLLLIIPLYLLFLIPFAVVGGDAKYVPVSTLYSLEAWKLAAARQATSVHLAFLHPSPAQAFRFLSVELGAKIFLPVLTQWTTSKPMFQMVLVMLTMLTTYVVSVLYAPFVERKFSVMVQDLKLVTVCAMVCGVFTVYLDDPDSYLPIYAMGGSIGAVVLGLLIKLCVMEASRPFVRKYPARRDPSQRPADVESPEAPLLQEGGEAREVVTQAAEEE